MKVGSPLDWAGQYRINMVIIVLIHGIIRTQLFEQSAKGEKMANLFERYPPPGQQIQVNHHNMHIQHLGDHGPAVLFEAGQAGFSLDWMCVQPAVSRFAQTWAYDRAGLGWSEAGPLPRKPQQVVAEFQALIEAAVTPGPFVIVAHSLGVRYACLYTSQYPANVAGLVLV